MIRTAVRTILTGLAALIVAGAVPAGAAQAATTFVLKSGGVYAPETVKITGPGVNRDVYATALKFTAAPQGSNVASLQFWAFCIDLFHAIDVGVNTQKSMNLTYKIEPFLTDGNGVVLSAAQRTQILGLADLGFDLIKLGDPQLALKLAGVQTAIWRIEYPTLTFTPNKAAVKTYANQYAALAPTLQPQGVTTIYALNKATQGFAIPGVPEPGTWALLILGFGATGFALRRRSSAVAAPVRA